MKLICKNKRAYYDYYVVEKLECGIVLHGTEVRSLAEGKVSIDEAYAVVSENEVWLLNCDIQKYEIAKHFNHEPKRERKLLLHKKEIEKFAKKSISHGFTLIPLSMYFKENKVKVELAICKGKKNWDKRLSIKNKELFREIKENN